jgi:hypothetical protein
MRIAALPSWTRAICTSRPDCSCFRVARRQLLQTLPCPMMFN